MANHRAAAARLLLMASLLVAVAFFSEAEARPTTVRRPNKTATLRGADVRRTGRNDTGHTTVHRDGDGRGSMADAAAPALSEPDCDEDKHHHKHHHHKHHDHSATPEMAPTYQPHPVTPELAPTYDKPHPATPEMAPTCDTCGKPKPEPPPPPPPKPEPPCSEPKPEPPCSSCGEPEPEPELTCSKVHGVQEGETCYSVGQCAELSQDDFLDFNPNIDCNNLFVGQWVCLEATCA